MIENYGLSQRPQKFLGSIGAGKLGMVGADQPLELGIIVVGQSEQELVGQLLKAVGIGVHRKGLYVIGGRGKRFGRMGTGQEGQTRQKQTKKETILFHNVTK